jgi:VWFA-related protein
MKTRIQTAVFVICSCVAVLAGQQDGQPAPPVTPAPATAQPPVTFRVEVNYVEVDATVTDADGNAVPDLTAADFEILEDGKPQRINAFSFVNLPVARLDRPLFASAPIEPDVQSNALVDGRLYLIVLDDYQIDATRGPRVTAAVRTFIERHFGANDMAAIVYTSGRPADGQDFTNNPRLLLASVDKFTGRKLRSSTLERIDEYNRTQSSRQAGQPVLDPIEFERAHQARMTMDSIRRLADFMAGIRGRRKAMLLFSEGIDYDIYDVFNNRSASTLLDESREAIAAATRGNVSIYGIDPRGLMAPGDELIETSGVPNDPSLNLGLSSSLAETRLAHESLRVMAGETGGFALLNRNDFTDGFERIVRENSSYYVLGYYPENERRDGRYRKLTVRVKRPGLRVRARTGYVAPRGRAPETRTAGDAGLPAAVREAMESPLPVTGIPMTVVASAYKGTAPNAAVALAIELDTDGFNFVEKDGTFTNRLDIGITAVDIRGKLLGSSRHGVTMAMKPDTFARVQERGVRVVSQLDVPPGRMQLHVAAGEAGGKVGSVIYELEIPEFDKAPLSMSGVSITSASARETTTVTAKDPLSQFLPGPPTTVREFARNDEIAVFVEFYENVPGAPAHTVDITTSIRSDDGRVVFENREQRSSTELQGGRGGYGHTAILSLKDVAPGLYVMRVEARSRAGGSESGVGRDVQFHVR